MPDPATTAKATGPDDAVRRRAAGMLVLTCAFWGLSFPLMKDWHAAAGQCPGGPLVAAAALIALRMGLALAILLAVRPGLLRDASRREHAIGALVGVAFAISFFLQVLGLAYTTPAHSAFFTSLASAWVPPLGWLLFRTRSAPVMLLGIGVAMVGAVVLLLRPSDVTGINLGDALTIAASLFFTLQVLLLDRLGRQVNSAHLTTGVFVVTAVPAALAAVIGAGLHGGLGEGLAWVAGMLGRPRVLASFLLLTVLSTTLAFHWMNVYQPRLPAARAALIYFLEPVCGTGFSVVLGHDDLTVRLVAGGLLILLGNLLVELPVWRRPSAIS